MALSAVNHKVIIFLHKCIYSIQVVINKPNVLEIALLVIHNFVDAILDYLLKQYLRTLFFGKAKTASGDRWN